MTSFRQEINLFWWYNALKPETGMVDLIFYDSQNHEIKNFQTPNIISFKRAETNKTLIFTQQEVTVPTDYEYWTTEFMDKNIVVTKITINPGEALMVHFGDLNETTILDVVVKENMRPTFNEFSSNASATIISKDNHLVQYYFERKLTTATVLYMGVLINPKMVNRKRYRLLKTRADVQNLTVKYSVAYDNPQCLSWVRITRSWNSTHCKVGRNQEKPFFLKLITPSVGN